MNIVRINSKKKARLQAIVDMPLGTIFEGTKSGELFVKTGPKVSDIVCFRLPKSNYWNNAHSGVKNDHPGRLVDLVEIKYKER